MKGSDTMIYTRFGTEVEIHGGDTKTGDVSIIRVGIDFKPLKTTIAELRADGGINEIMAEVDRINKLVNA